MKNLATILKAAALAVATLAMSSCVVNDNEPFNNEPQAIGFNAVVGPISDSRAVITDLNYPNTLPFAAFASQLGDGKTWDTNKAEAVQLIGGDAVAYNTYLPGKWTTEAAYYWPDFGSLTFFAYSPYFDAQGNKINNIAFTPTTGELKVTGWDVAAAEYKDVDLMMADVQKDLTSDLAPSGVPVAFRHKLARVSFKAGLIQDYTLSGVTYHLYLQSVELRKVKTKGNYSSLADQWSGQSQEKTVVIYQNPSANKANGYDVTTDISANVGQILTMPQVHLAADDLSQAYIYVEWYDSRDGSSGNKSINMRNAITDSHWAANNHYTYLLLWERGEPKYIEFTTPTVDTWADGGSYTITID
ncbi:MAG: fimbrillin family protein [Tidjanibacter sp.]|nr:fimbrillin family protein [Tidjanibacter sp.]